MQNVKELGYIMTITGVLLMINGLMMIITALTDKEEDNEMPDMWSQSYF